MEFTSSNNSVVVRTTKIEFGEGLPSEITDTVAENTIFRKQTIYAQDITESSCKAGKARLNRILAVNIGLGVLAAIGVSALILSLAEPHLLPSLLQHAKSLGSEAVSLFR